MWYFFFWTYIYIQNEVAFKVGPAGPLTLSSRAWLVRKELLGFQSVVDTGTRCGKEYSMKSPLVPGINPSSF